MANSILLVVLALVVTNCMYSEALAHVFAILTSASYCHQDLINAWNCTICQTYPYISNIKPFYNSSHNIGGYIATDERRNATVIVFRGTQPSSIKNWLDNIDTVKVKYPLCDTKCEVHKGFYKAYE